MLACLICTSTPLHEPNVTTSCKRNAPKSFCEFQREKATRHTCVSSTEKNRRRMLCAGDVANAGVASCAAGAEFGWYLATCVINTWNFVSENHSTKINTARWWYKTPTQAFVLSSLTFFNRFQWKRWASHVLRHQRNVTSTTFRKQSMRPRHRTTKPSHPQDINTNGHSQHQKNSTHSSTIQYDLKSFTPPSYRVWLKQNITCAEVLCWRSLNRLVPLLAAIALAGFKLLNTHKKEPQTDKLRTHQGL